MKLAIFDPPLRRSFGGTFPRVINEIFAGALGGYVNEYPVGGKSNPHSHPNSQETFICTGGSGIVTVGGKETPSGEGIVDGEEKVFEKGDVVVVEPGILHQIINTSIYPLTCVCLLDPPLSDEAFRVVHSSP